MGPLTRNTSILDARESHYRNDVCWANPIEELTNTSAASTAPWLVVALPTVPRYGSERYLINTIDALLLQLPENTGSKHGFLFFNFRIVVVSHPRGEPEGHPVLKAAEKVHDY
jgi:hypothetical protein